MLGRADHQRVGGGLDELRNDQFIASWPRTHHSFDAQVHGAATPSSERATHE
jgi:hypothetical protein